MELFIFALLVYEDVMVLFLFFGVLFRRSRKGLIIRSKPITPATMRRLLYTCQIELDSGRFVKYSSHFMRLGRNA